MKFGIQGNFELLVEASALQASITSLPFLDYLFQVIKAVKLLKQPKQLECGWKVVLF